MMIQGVGFIGTLDACLGYEPLSQHAMNFTPPKNKPLA